MRPLFTDAVSRRLSCLTVIFLAASCESGVELSKPQFVTAMSELSSPSCKATKMADFDFAGDKGRLVFSVDGQLALFHRASDTFGLEIVESRRVNGRWTAPERVAFASPYTEFDPFISIDGRSVYYTSFRPLTGTDARPDGDIWRVERTRSGWGTPQRLDDTVNTADNEFFPSVTADGTLYFNSPRAVGVGVWDLWRAKRNGTTFRAAELVPGNVNTAIWEYNPSLTPGGSVLAFGSLDPDPAAPFSDVFLSVRINGEYTRGVNAGPCVNTELEEYHPTLDWARGRLIFVRRNVEGNGEFFEVKLPELLSQVIR